MTCEEALRLIHLNRDGERTPEEDQALRVHLEGCPLCSSEARLVRDTAGMLARIQASEPRLPEPEDLSAKILSALAEPEPREHSRTFGAAMDMVLNAFLRPAVRAGYAVTALVLVGTFILQQAQAFRSVDALGTRLSQGPIPQGAEVQFSIPLEDARHIVGASALEPLLSAAPVTVSRDRISVLKSEIEPWGPSLPSRLAARLLASSAPIEELPDVLLELEKSISLSLKLRNGGNNP